MEAMKKQRISINADFPEKLKPIFQPYRYKILYGGRGGAKSHSVAAALLILGARTPLRILCAREFQASIADSVHKLLSDKINDIGLDLFYEVQRTTIKGKNGTEFIFAGLRHNVTSIKSMEGCDIVWVEEAHTVSKSSWDILIPTIRKPGSEIWLTFNPELESDETYDRFITNPPTDALVLKVNWSDNPWFPDVLRQEMEDLKKKDYDAYLNVWEGHCRTTLDGAIYANEIRQAIEDGRFTSVPWDKAKPVNVFFDLGRSDMTSIWFSQIIGFEYRIIDFFEDQGHAMDYYIQILQNRGYVYGTVWLPHDGKHKLLASNLTIEQQVRDAGFKVEIVPSISVADGINHVRTAFNRCWFDKAKCSDGISALTHYRYDVNPDTGQYSKEPKHDWACHSADSFRYQCIAYQYKPDREKKKSNPQRRQGGGWMAA